MLRNNRAIIKLLFTIFVVPHSELDSTAELRRKVQKLETTRHINFWQDHSDIGGGKN